MRFQLLDILPHIENPVTGRLVSTADRLEQAVTAARQAERLGLDAVARGERHAGPFLSAGVTVVLGAIAAATSRVAAVSVMARPGAGRPGPPPWPPPDGPGAAAEPPGGGGEPVGAVPQPPPGGPSDSGRRLRPRW